MTSIYYSAVWTDSGCLLSCWHEHPTVREAAECIIYAGAYVLATENGVLRALTVDEEAEFQRAIYATRTDKPALDAIRAADERYRNDGTRYAVMVRIKVVDHYQWTTWMTYGTYGEAAAHAGTAHRIVAFGSPQWVELKKHIVPVLTDEEHKELKRSARAANRPTRREDETLLEYVNRFLEAYGVSQRTLTKEEDEHLHVTLKLLRVRVSDFVEFVLNWLNEWETKELERMHALQVPEWLEALGKRVRRAFKHEAPTGR
jgi:hypothetical protein